MHEDSSFKDLYYDTPTDAHADHDDSAPPDTDILPDAVRVPDCNPVPEVLPALPLPADVLQESATHWFWRIILLLTAWMNLHYHLPHRACILLLKVLQVIFLGLGHLTPEDEAPVTLTTTFRCLNLNDEFQICPTCPGCNRIYDSDSPASLKCAYCNIPLFKFWDGNANNSQKTGSTPILQCPHCPISDQLPQILNRVSIEEACEAWRTQAPKPGFKTKIMDGNVWKSILGSNGKPFFNNNSNREDAEEL